jgi:hypothetical protein
MSLVGYRIAFNSTREVDLQNMHVYDVLSQIQVIKDYNGNGYGELMLVNEDMIRKPILWQDWSLSSKIDIRYSWGHTDLDLSITDPKGITKTLPIEIKWGSQSTQWGVDLLSATVRTFKTLISSISWEHYYKNIEITEATQHLNALILQVEVANANLNKLRSEFKYLL